MPLAFTIDPTEARALGVLIEKQLTTPDQYPLSLNALTNGCNQKSNRHPVLSLKPREVQDAILRLRVAQLVDFVDGSGSRVEHYAHRAPSTLHLQPPEVAVLAELMLRGPQSQGDLRGRASRMHPIPTLDDLMARLRPLIERGFVVQLPPAVGSRATRYGQLLCPESHPQDATEVLSLPAPPGRNDPDEGTAASNPGASPREGQADLLARITTLEAELSALRSRVDELAARVD